jgi:hypothetical protein
MEKGERVKAAPAMTGLDNWIEGIILPPEGFQG